MPTRRTQRTFLSPDPDSLLKGLVCAAVCIALAALLVTFAMGQATRVI